MITENSKVTVSVGILRTVAATILALLIWMAGASWKVYGYVQTLSANTIAIQNVATSLELGRVNDEIGDLRKEMRDLQRKYSRDPEDEDINELISEQIEEIEDEIMELEHQRDCIEDPYREVCE
jgi:DNA-binding transcriptional regulator GbsR (MarR family)